MHRLAVVAQGLLRETFGIADGLGAFRPSVAVAVKRDALDAELAAMAFNAAARGVAWSEYTTSMSTESRGIFCRNRLMAVPPFMAECGV
jgi:hypothetical protein